MMKVSSRVHYGLRAMTELAKAYGSVPLPLSEIAKTEHLPLAYLEQLVADLRRAGLVEGVRGLHGGYRLTCMPGQVSVGDVVRALDGPIVLVECLAEDYQPGMCEREPECLSRSIWHRVQQSIEGVLDSTSLEDLCRSHPFDLKGNWTVLPVLSGSAIAGKVDCSTVK